MERGGGSDNDADMPLCQRCQLVESFGVLTWDPRHLINREDIPPGAPEENYTPAYNHLCRRCFEEVFHPVDVRTPQDIADVLQRWKDAEQLIERDAGSDADDR